MWKACEPFRIIREGCRKNLQGDVATELGVFGPIDLPHAAAPQERQDVVRAEPTAGNQGHAFRRRDYTDCVSLAGTFEVRAPPARLSPWRCVPGERGRVLARGPTHRDDTGTTTLFPRPA